MSPNDSSSRREFLRVAAASLLCACPSKSTEEPSMTTASTNPDPPADGSASPEPFRLDDHVMGGQRMATEPGPHGRTLEIHEWTSWLRVRSDERVAVLVQTRREGDLVGQPVGWYRRELDERQLAKLRQSIESIQWSSLPPLRGGDIGANHYALEYQRGSLLVQRQWNARNFDFMAAISPYMEAASELMTFLGERPMGLVKASVQARQEPGTPGRYEFKLVLENPGAGPIVLTDPRVPAAAGAKGPRMVLRVAPGTNGWTEPSWKPLPMPALPEGAPRTVIVPAGGRLEFAAAAPWQASAPGIHYLRGEWIDYEGPVEPVADQLPLVPLAEDGPTPAMRGPYPVRGAAFAEGIELDIPAGPAAR